MYYSCLKSYIDDLFYFFFNCNSAGDVLSGSESDGIVHLGVLQEWFGIHWWNSRAFSLLLVVLLVLLPLLLLRRIG